MSFITVTEAESILGADFAPDGDKPKQSAVWYFDNKSLMQI